jgi:hypothetical protein
MINSNQPVLDAVNEGAKPAEVFWGSNLLDHKARPLLSVAFEFFHRLKREQENEHKAEASCGYHTVFSALYHAHAFEFEFEFLV